jgi:anaerobic selenocysteine-containing dehydrogenase
MPGDIASELRRFAEQAAPADGQGKAFTHLLASRRLRDAMNSMVSGSDYLARRVPFNPAFLHPDDIAALGLQSGDRVRIESGHGTIDGILRADPTLRPGVVQMSHAWGGLPDEAGADYETDGSNVGLLISNETNIEPINAMARQSAIPVNILPVVER